MNNPILLSPHNDDETLFAAFQCLAHRPLVVVCLRSKLQEDRGTGVTYQVREYETAAAMGILGCEYGQWTFPDSDPDWEKVGLWIESAAGIYDHCFAPAFEEGGHEQHNQIAELAERHFAGRLTNYLTYTRAGGKTTSGRLVHREPAWVTLKLRALACYRSQIETAAAGCTDHFAASLEEYLA